MKEKSNRANPNATTQQNSKPNREDEKKLNQVEREGRYEDKQNHELNKEKVKKKDDTGYKDNDSKIGNTGSTTENNENTNTQNEEKDEKQIEKGKDGERKNIEKDHERNKKKRQNAESVICKRGKEYVETGVYC